MFRKIMVCTDLSPASDALVQCIEELKTIGLEEVVLAHALPYAGLHAPEEAGRTLERQVGMLTQQGLRVTVEMPAGPTADALSEAAERHDVSFIFTGSHGKGIIRAATLGSVSVDLLQRARRPVLLARIELLESAACRVACRTLFSKVLFATDFSQPAERALVYVGAMARESGAPVTLLHVLHYKTKDAAEMRQADERAEYLLEAKKRRLEAAGASGVAVALAKGSPGKGIVDFAREGGFSLIAMGFQGKGIVEEALMGGAAYQAAHHAGVPVLFVPAPE